MNRMPIIALTCAHTHSRTDVCAHTHSCAHTNKQTNTHAHTHIHAHTHAHIKTNTHTRSHPRAHTRACTHKHTHTCTHTDVVASGGKRVTEYIGSRGLLAIGSTGTFYSNSGPFAEMRETSLVLDAGFKIQRMRNRIKQILQKHEAALTDASASRASKQSGSITCTVPHFCHDL